MSWPGKGNKALIFLSLSLSLASSDCLQGPFFPRRDFQHNFPRFVLQGARNLQETGIRNKDAASSCAAVCISPLPLPRPWGSPLHLLLRSPQPPLRAPWHRTTDGDLFACDTVTKSKLKETSHQAAN